MASKHKTIRLENDSDSEDEVIEGAWPRFLVVEGADPDKPLAKLSPFAIATGFRGVSSTITKIKKMRDGAYLVECPTEKVSKLLLRRHDSIFVDRRIKVSPHRALNSCKGVIRCRELQDVPDEEILQGLRSQGVTELHRVTRKKDEGRVPTYTFFLTFTLPALPEFIKTSTHPLSVTRKICQ